MSGVTRCSCFEIIARQAEFGRMCGLLLWWRLCAPTGVNDPVHPLVCSVACGRLAGGLLQVVCAVWVVCVVWADNRDNLVVRFERGQLRLSGLSGLPGGCQTTTGQPGQPGLSVDNPSCLRTTWVVWVAQCKPGQAASLGRLFCYANLFRHTPQDSATTKTK